MKEVDYNLKRHDLLMLLMGVREKEKNYEMPVDSLPTQWLMEALDCNESEFEFELILSELLSEGEIEMWQEYGYRIKKNGITA